MLQQQRLIVPMDLILTFCKVRVRELKQPTFLTTHVSHYRQQVMASAVQLLEIKNSSQCGFTSVISNNYCLQLS